MAHFNKKQLDTLATLCGAITGICTVLITQEIGSTKIIGTISGIALVFLGIITQRPADKRPTTEDVEQRNT